jgi:hypothetical protein
MTRRDAWLTAMVLAMIRSKSISANPLATNALAPSEA